MEQNKENMVKLKVQFDWTLHKDKIKEMSQLFKQCKNKNVDREEMIKWAIILAKASPDIIGDIYGNIMFGLINGNIEFPEESNNILTTTE